MHLILTGATGTCGAAVLKRCVADPAITRVTILSRRPVPQAEGEAKVNVLIHNDFNQYPQAVLDQLKDAEGCVWALGISSTLVKKDEYVKITYDYTMAAATAFAGLSVPFKFVYVSGEGADPTERTSAIFAKTKGRTENELYALAARTPSFRAFIARPGLIDPEGEHLRSTPRTTLEITSQIFLAPILRQLGKAYIIGTNPLARALIHLATGNGEHLPEGPGVEREGMTLRNTALRRLAGI